MKDWHPPALPALANVYGSTVLEQFVLGHSVSEIVSELMQNEFDAGGDRIVMQFGLDRLHIEGNGQAVTDDGWKRLGVVLGTGAVSHPSGETDFVPPKPHAVGSKNFGLRSLFRFGDRIWISSAGRGIVKDLIDGSSEPYTDPNTAGKSHGIKIDVPYRAQNTGALRPFGVDDEVAMLDELMANLPRALINLGGVSGPGVRTVRLEAERAGRTLTWSRTAKLLNKSTSASSVEREVRLHDSAENHSRARSVLRSVEYQRVLRMPDEGGEMDLPRYFLDRRSRRWIGVSVELRGGRVLTEAEGRLFYPLGLAEGLTGCAVSINAPFLLDQDRSRCQPDNSWNDRLQELAADIAIEAMRSDWLDRFGPDALLALRKRSPGSEHFHRRANNLLRREQCWPTAATRRGRIVLAKAEDVSFPEDRRFSPFLQPRQKLPEAARQFEELAQFAKDSGASRFTLNSLVRLRSGPQAADGLRTEPGVGESNFYYPDFEERLLSQAVQLQFATVLDALWPRLRPDHRRDLADSPTTLAADGSLRPAATLWAVPPGLVKSAPVPPATMLHPKLSALRNFSRLSKPFRVGHWVESLCTHIAEDAADLHDREALYQYVLATHAKFSARIVAQMRGLPVLKDSRSHWVAPVHLLAPHPRLAAFEAVLHIAHPDVARDKALLRRLRIRAKPGPEEWVAMAEQVADHPGLAPAWESAFRQEPPSKAACRKLAGVRFVHLAGGRLACPSELYMDRQAVREVLGPNAAYIERDREAVYRLLGCHTTPRSQGIVAFLAELANQGAKVPRPARVYGALVEALGRENLDATHYADEPIVNVGNRYFPPRQVMVGAEVPEALRAVLPWVAGPRPLVAALQALGGRTVPGEDDWVKFLAAVGEHTPESEAVPPRVAESLRAAYERLGPSWPAALPVTARCLLARSGALASYQSVLQGRFLIDDDPELADAFVQAGAPVHFADHEYQSCRFFSAIGVRSLSSVLEAPALRAGPWLPDAADRERHCLDRMRRPALVGAAAALASARLAGPAADYEAKLQDLRQVAFVSSLQLEYRLRGVSVRVPTEAWFSDSVLYMISPLTEADLTDMMASGTAQLLAGDPRAGARLVDALARLLALNTAREMESFLKRRHIRFDGAILDAGQEAGSTDPEPVAATAAGHPPTQFAGRSWPGDGLAAGAAALPALAADSPPETRSDTEAALVLPLIETQFPRIEAAPVLSAPSHQRVGGGGSRHRLGEPDASDGAEIKVGNRGEELVYLAERGRVAKMGQSPDLVRWVSREFPTSDYDIESVDEDREPIWIEVKATRGEKGRFQLSQAEYERARLAGSRYVLVRVYRTASPEPVVRYFRDPLALCQAGAMTLDVASYWGEVAPCD